MPEAVPPTPRRARRRKVVTTVNLEPAVRSYLDLLMTRHDRDRSYIVNALVRRHMNEEGRQVVSGVSGGSGGSGDLTRFPPPVNAF